MSEEEVLQELTAIFREVFDNDDLVIGRSTSAANLARWDSLNHINLMMAVELHFGIKFRAAELEKMTDVGDLVDTIAKKVT